MSGLQPCGPCCKDTFARDLPLEILCCRHQTRAVWIKTGNTPPSAAVLLTALTVTDGVLSALGHAAGPLESITLADGSNATLKAHALQDCAEKEEVYEVAPRLSFSDAKKQLTADSLFARYTPEVYSELQQLQGQAIYR